MSFLLGLAGIPWFDVPGVEFPPDPELEDGCLTENLEKPSGAGAIGAGAGYSRR
jgi:hypothetical protein